MTPEGKVKAAISKRLKKYFPVYKFMPVPSGYGPSSLDFIICWQGRFIAIEAKAPGKKPTPRQKLIMAEIKLAGGSVFVIDSTDGLGPLTELLEQLSYDSARINKT